jgi:hypothetical protein
MEEFDAPTGPGRKMPLTAVIVVALLGALGAAFVFPGCFGH